MEKYLIILSLISLFFISKLLWPIEPAWANDTVEINTIPVSEPIVTQSRFTQKLEEESETLPKQTVYQDDPETEAGEEKVIDEGSDGKKVRIFKVTYESNEEFDRELVSADITPAVNKRILRGTKIIWKNLDTADGTIRYWKKMRVYATHYDSHCLGCNEWTATGMRQGKGVIAVDPKIIPLRSKLFVPGYGMAIAGDTGGAIKGNIIDLGFDDARTAGWYAHFIDIYLM
jgi:resuscitation-promoting factor RpfB